MSALSEEIEAKDQIERALETTLQKFTKDTGLIVQTMDLRVIDTSTISGGPEAQYAVNLDIRIGRRLW